MLTLLSCLAVLGLVNAQQSNPAFDAGCPTTRAEPPPRGAFCNVQGRVDGNATDPKLAYDNGFTVTADQCANGCKTNRFNCEFFSFKPNTTANPFDPDGGLVGGTCTIFKFGPNYFNFKQGPNPDDPRTKYFSKQCYFTPSTCSFNLRCVRSDNGKPCPRSNNFLAVDPNGGSSFSPTGFASTNASNPNKITRFSNSYARRLSVYQDGEQYFASIPRSDRRKKNSIASFVPGSALTATATPLNCQVTFGFGMTVNCSPEDYDQYAGGDSAKGFPNLCPKAAGGDGLQYEYIGDGATGPCKGGIRVSLSAVDYTAVP